jgi:hypothetical protein
MNKNQFTKKLFPSNLGDAGMHDKYITVPKKIDPVNFFGNPPKTITCADKVTGILYSFPFSYAANGEFRLTQFGPYFENKNAEINDEIYIEKVNLGTKTTYIIDIIKKIFPRPYEIDTLLPDEVREDSEEYYTEGSTIKVLVNKYERNTEARTKCIKHYGAVCSACLFDFEDEYGEIGKGFIHVHHLVPMSEIKESYVVNPIDDLVPVCPNCHAMIHKRNPPYSIVEIKKMLE